VLEERKAQTKYDWVAILGLEIHWTFEGAQEFALSSKVQNPFKSLGTLNDVAIIKK
jgi:hypothetical protein